MVCHSRCFFPPHAIVDVFLFPFGRQDVHENKIVADYVSAALRRAGAGDLECTEAFLKRLTHVQHICR